MKYIYAICLCGFPEEEKFDSSCDLTFSVGHKFHNPANGMFVVKHGTAFLSEEQVEEMKFRTFTPEGGI